MGKLSSAIKNTTRRKCLWHAARGGKECENPAIPETQYCSTHLKRLEVIALRRMGKEHSPVLQFGKKYFESLVIFLMGAAGTATAQIIVKHWDAIWALIHFDGMSPPGMYVMKDGRPNLFIGRWDQRTNQFLDFGLAPIPTDEAVKIILAQAEAASE